MHALHIYIHTYTHIHTNVHHTYTLCLINCFFFLYFVFIFPFSFTSFTMSFSLRLFIFLSLVNSFYAPHFSLSLSQYFFFFFSFLLFINIASLLGISCVYQSLCPKNVRNGCYPFILITLPLDVCKIFSSSTHNFKSEEVLRQMK